MQQIDTLRAETGRLLKEDGTVVNEADILFNALDPLQGFAVYNELEHSIHKGTSYGFTAHGSIANGANLTLIGRLQAKQVHFEGLDVQLQTGGVLLELIESPTITVLGTAQSARRKNRATVNNATLLIYSGATITNGTGTVIYDSLPPLVSGIGNSIDSTQTSIQGGWVLKQNTDYAIRLTNQSGATITFNAAFGWHEPDIILG